MSEHQQQQRPGYVAHQHTDVELAGKYSKQSQTARLLQQGNNGSHLRPQDVHPHGNSDQSIEQPAYGQQQAGFSDLQQTLQYTTHITHDYIVRHYRGITTFLVAISRVLEQTDASLLPAVYFYVGCAFNATPAQLGSITLARLLVSAFASPIGGWLGHHYNRVRLVACACWYWALCTIMFACSTSTHQGMVLWAFNGIGLGIMIPNAQSLVADYYDATHRGRAFGMLLAVGNLGSMVSSAYATNIGGASIFGLQGWRFAFLSVAVVSSLAGIAMWVAAKDPRCSTSSWQLDEHWKHQLRANAGSSSSEARGTSGFVSLSELSSSGRQGGLLGSVRRLMQSPIARETWVVLTTPSFMVVVVQGFLGSMPWAAFAFVTLYLQLQGWSDAAASTIMALFAGADAAGAFLGGIVGDWAAARFPDHGRITVCQFSVVIGVPLCILIFQGLPLGSSTGIWAIYGVVFGTMGLLISWAATACNNPVFAEIVPPHLRTLVYAFDRCLETVLSAFGAPLVGVAAQGLFHFSGTATTQDCSAGRSRTQTHQPDFVKARALGNALTLFSTVPWTLCALVYSLLHCTYPRDKRRSACTGDPLVSVQFSPLPVTEEPTGLANVSPTPLPVPGGILGVVNAVDGYLNQVDEYITNSRTNGVASSAVDEQAVGWDGVVVHSGVHSSTRQEVSSNISRQAAAAARGEVELRAG